MRPVYLDHHATTPCDPRVVEQMLPYFTEQFGNAHSLTHGYGREAARAVDRARGQVAALVGAQSQEIVFLSGGTEADNLAIKGVASACRGEPRHVITSQVEHQAVLESCRWLQDRGWSVTFLPVDATGQVNPQDLKKALRPETVLVSVMFCNNEIGTVQPLEEIGRMTREHGAWLHADAVQGLGWLPFDVQRLPVDLVSMSAHKIYGPKGVGALYVRRDRQKSPLACQQHGGGHERGVRPGTLNVPGIVGFGMAAALVREQGPTEAQRVRQLRDLLWRLLSRELEGLHLNGPALSELRHPGNLHVAFDGVSSAELMDALAEDVAVSAGSACSSVTAKPSHVLMAIGASEERAFSSIRMGLGRSTTEQQVRYVAERITTEVKRLRASQAPSVQA